MSQPVNLSDEIVLDARLTRLAGAGRPLSECLAAVDSDQGRHHVFAYLDARPYPHYEPTPSGNGLLVRIAADGTRSLGRFVDREFRVID